MIGLNVNFTQIGSVLYQPLYNPPPNPKFYLINFPAMPINPPNPPPEPLPPCDP